MLRWSAPSMLPDADVVGLFGARYGAAWGHRGATHSFAFSLGVGMLLGLAVVLVMFAPPFAHALWPRRMRRDAGVGERSV